MAATAGETKVRQKPGPKPGQKARKKPGPKLGSKRKPKINAQTAPAPAVQEAVVSVVPALKSQLSNLNSRKIKTALVTLLILILAASTGFLGWQYHQDRDEIARLSDPQAAAQQEVTNVTKQVASLITIPDETPTLATVTDPSKLQKQTFFAQAQTGDKVLIFTKAKRAILYRPSTHKVIESAPVSLNTAPTAATQSDTIPAVTTVPSPDAGLSQ